MLCFADSFNPREPAVDLTVRFDELQATTVAGENVVRAIDEFPVWSVVATQAAGSSRLRDAAELRVKESDRIELVVEETVPRIGLYQQGLTLGRILLSTDGRRRE